MPLEPEGTLRIQVVPGASLSPAQKSEVIALCDRAYEEEMGPLMATFTGATHLLGFCRGLLVSHALWVTRALQVGAGPLLRTAYVEAVATDHAWRRRGFAAALMERLLQEVQAFDLAALSPFSVDYYARLGWEPWRGPLFIRWEGVLLPSPPDEDVMVHRLPATPPLDLTSPLSAEWREGELW